MGRTRVYYFNPTCELAVANGSFSYMPPLLLQEMERDLSVLPFIFASGNDYVVTENQPSAAFLQEMKRLGFDLPAFCSLHELGKLPPGSFSELCPWGWSPAAHFKLKGLKEKCADELSKSPVFHWREKHHLLFERSTSLDFLFQLLDQAPNDWFIDRSLAGTKVTTIEEVESILRKQRPVVIKAPVSSSGRGIQMIRKNNLNESNKQWISGVLKQQNYLIVEPLLEKLFDLSFQFKVSDVSEIEYLGHSIFETNSNGQYKGTLIKPDLKTIWPEGNGTIMENLIDSTAERIRKTLMQSVYGTDHRGYLGVDALIFSDRGNVKIHPCLEINCRMNMGILTLLLEEKVHASTSGKFELFYGAPGEFRNYASAQTLLNPPKYRDGKLFSGFLSLVEPDHNTRYGAYITLGSAK